MRLVRGFHQQQPVFDQAHLHLKILANLKILASGTKLRRTRGPYELILLTEGDGVVCPWQQEHYRTISFFMDLDGGWAPVSNDRCISITRGSRGFWRGVVLMFYINSDSSRTKQCPSQLASRWSDYRTALRAVLPPKGVPSAVLRTHRNLHPQVSLHEGVEGTAM